MTKESYRKRTSRRVGTDADHVDRRLTAGELYRRAPQADTWWSPVESRPRTRQHAGPRTRQHARPQAGRARGRTGRRGLVVARTVVVLCSVLAFGAAGAVWFGSDVLRTGLGFSAALDGATRSTDGAQNILLMGLDTRKDKDGNNLPADIMRQLHAGDGDEGGYNTNTLILVHIPADRKNIIGFSIPRDDLVRTTGLDVSQAKIKEVYGRTKAQVTQQMLDSGVSDQHTLESKGREAGRTATLQAVRDLTGVPIDRFAEVSLIGFYDLAKALDGVDVCLRHAVSDSYSGADFPAGPQRLDAAQTLAFVRQRHGLTNGDLDRTHRQQAFLLSTMHQVQSAGTLTDPTKLSALMGVVDSDVVLSSGWDVVSWVQQMSSVSGQKIAFRTLPVRRYATVDGQDVNLIDPQAIRAQVRTAFGMAPAPASASASSASASAGGAAEQTTSAGSEPTTDAAAPPDSGSAVDATSGVPCVN